MKKKVKKVLFIAGWVTLGLAMGLLIKGHASGIRYSPDRGFYDSDVYRKTIVYHMTKNPAHLKYKYDHLDAVGICERMFFPE
jgi:hypothetical protein